MPSPVPIITTPAPARGRTGDKPVRGNRPDPEPALSDAIGLVVSVVPVALNVVGVKQGTVVVASIEVVVVDSPAVVDVAALVVVAHAGVVVVDAPIDVVVVASPTEVEVVESATVVVVVDSVVVVVDSVVVVVDSVVVVVPPVVVVVDPELPELGIVNTRNAWSEVAELLLVDTRSRQLGQSGRPFEDGPSSGAMQLNLLWTSSPFLNAWKACEPLKVAVPVALTLTGPGASPKSQSLATLQLESVGSRPSHCVIKTLTPGVYPDATTVKGNGLPLASPGTAKGDDDGVVTVPANATPAASTQPTATADPRRRRRETAMLIGKRPSRESGARPLIHAYART